VAFRGGGIQTRSLRVAQRSQAAATLLRHTPALPAPATTENRNALHAVTAAAGPPTAAVVLKPSQTRKAFKFRSHRPQRPIPARPPLHRQPPP
jgi:hypothetical protein